MLKKLLIVFSFGLLLCLLLYAAISDNFDGAFPGAKWTLKVGTWQIDTNEVEATSSGVNDLLIYTGEATTGINHYARAIITRSAASFPGIVLRYDVGETFCYAIETNGTTVYWYKVNISTGAGTIIASNGTAHNSGNPFGARVNLTAANTTIEVWNNPTGAYTSDPSAWGAVTYTFIDNPGGDAVDVGTSVGLVGYQAGTERFKMNDFGGGPVAAGNGDEENAVFFGANFSGKKPEKKE